VGLDRGGGELVGHHWALPGPAGPGPANLGGLSQGTAKPRAGGRRRAPRATPHRAGAGGRSGGITFVPENWATTYTQWLDNIQDWCIRRRRGGGLRTPA